MECLGKDIMGKWKINKLLDDILQESGCEPHEVMARAKCKTVDDVSHVLIQSSHMIYKHS
jgi:hypothetical protein